METELVEPSRTSVLGDSGRGSRPLPHSSGLLPSPNPESESEELEEGSSSELDSPESSIKALLYDMTCHRCVERTTKKKERLYFLYYCFLRVALCLDVYILFYVGCVVEVPPRDVAPDVQYCLVNTVWDIFSEELLHHEMKSIRGFEEDTSSVYVHLGGVGGVEIVERHY